MSEIFGFVNLNGKNVDRAKLFKMHASLENFPADSCKSHVVRNAAMGFHQFCITPESRFENLPLYDKENGHLFTAAARLDNRDDLCDIFGISCSDRLCISDADLVYKAWKKWEVNCPERLFGDWSFAAWNGRTEQLTIARDHIGNTGLYYYYKAPLFVFASNMEAILVHPDVRRELNETQFSYFLVNHTQGDLKETLWKNVSSLLPAHVLTVDVKNTRLKRYWNFEDISENRCSGSECLETFLSLFRRAVAARLRSEKPVSSTLSAGLDSTFVTALAAQLVLKQRGKLFAYTYEPMSHPSLASFGLMPNEWNLAHLVAARYDNIDHRSVAAAVSPLGEIRRSFHIFKALPHALANVFWINAMLDAVRENDSHVLLTGQMGNTVVSWHGGTNRIFHLFSQGKWDEGINALLAWKTAQNQSLLMAVKVHLVAPLFRPLIRRIRGISGIMQPGYSKYSVISNDFAVRTGVYAFKSKGFKRMVHLRPITPHEERMRNLSLNSATAGPFWHGMGSFFGVDVRDPTVDIRLLEFSLGVPDEECIHNGGQRMLMRRAMDGIVPDEIRWNQIRGNQAADIGLRLLVYADEVERELREIENSKLMNHYINVPVMRQVWENFKSSPTRQNYLWLAKLFLRGYAASVLLKDASGSLKSDA